jgi:hypothetical protein
VLEALSAAHLEAWRRPLDMIVQSTLHQLPLGTPVDLFTAVTLPLGLEIAMLVNQCPETLRPLLQELGRRVFAATGAGDDTALRDDAAAASAELERIFAGGPVPMAEPTFVALSQTMPRLLLNCWLALLRHPDQLALLRAQPDRLPSAVEELLRYAGIVRRVFRRATADADLGTVRIGAGDLVVLMLASANRDPQQYPDPDRLDFTRAIAGHVALGLGRNSCVGAMLIRLAAGVATGRLAGLFTDIRLERLGEWRTGSGFCFPSAVYAALFR